MLCVFDTQHLVSEPQRSMATHNKSNAEFRDEVQEILAKHESNFDQIHATLQTVLTEIQSLRIQHNSQNHAYAYV